MPIHDIPAPAKRRTDRRRRSWHSHFVLLGRVRCEASGKRYLIVFDTIERRYSPSRRRWLYRVEG